MGSAEAAQLCQILANVEGVYIVRDEHLLPDIPGHYVRARVRCPCDAHHASGKVCQKSRVVGRTTMARFGEQEPVAYLADWIRAASRFKSQKSHMKYKPGQAAVRAAIENLRSSGVEG